MFTRRVTEHESCGNTVIACGQLWTRSGRRAEGREMGGIYPHFGRRSAKAGMWCEQVVPSLCDGERRGLAPEWWRPHELSTVGENLGKSGVAGISGASGTS